MYKEIIKYDIKDIVKFFASSDHINNMIVDKDINNDINHICKVEDILMVSFYLAGRNSPMPYDKRGRKMSIGYMHNLYIRETGAEITESRKNQIIEEYGISAYEGLGRMVRNVVDLMQPLTVKIKIFNDKIEVVNSYVRVYDKDIVLNRLFIITRDKNEKLVMRDKKGDIPVKGFAKF